MIERLPMGPGDVIAYDLRGELTTEDVNKVHGDIRRTLEDHDALRLYIDAQNLEGITPRAVIEDLKLAPEYITDIARFAIIGDQRWQEWVTNASDYFTQGDARYFAPDEAARAQKWIRSDHN